MGKQEAGVLDGNAAFLGSFQECEAATDYAQPDENVNFTSEYCTVLALVISLFSYKLIIYNLGENIFILLKEAKKLADMKFPILVQIT